ncbi:MAG: adenylosuccinate lyase [Deltaproteobacteria bacterium]|nr:MAG: adenylosuccinate lyase [Deltaproteobacteria bacterium]
MIGRYETAAMRDIWNEEAQFARWTQVEVAACAAHHARGNIDDADWQAIESRAHHHSAARVRAYEAETQHDVVAFVRSVAQSVGPAGRHVHRGLTSSDVVDTALALAMRQSLDVVLAACAQLERTLAQRAHSHRRTLCAGRTHGVFAEPTSFGLRLAGFCSEVKRHRTRLSHARHNIAVGKLSGAVGTFSQTDPAFEQHVLAQLELRPEAIATQVIPRDRHAEVILGLASLGAGLERFALEVRHLQRTEVREVEEGFAAGQTGSSAMPHKRNPIVAERICGMARLLRGYAVAALEDVALWHDRDISHSSVERVICADAFHVVHYMLCKVDWLFANLRVYPAHMQQNLERNGGLVYSQSVLGHLLDAGMERQAAYRIVQRCAMRVWEKEAVSLRVALQQDAEAAARLSEAELDALFDSGRYLRHIDALFDRADIQRGETTCLP